MDLPTKGLRQLEPSILRSITLAALASFHAKFNVNAKMARVVGATSAIVKSKPDRVGHITNIAVSGGNLGFSFGADSRRSLCNLDDVLSPKEVCDEVESAGMEDVVFKQTVTVRDINNLPAEVSDLLEANGAERMATMETNHGFMRKMLGIHCASPAALLGGALSSADPHGLYDIGRLAHRVRGVLMQDVILVDTGKKFMNWCDLKPDYLTHKMLIDAWSKPFYTDMAMPKKISMEGSDVKGILFWLNKYGMPIGCR